VTFGTGTGKFVAFVGHLGTIGAVQTLTNGDVKLMNRSTGLIFFGFAALTPFGLTLGIIQKRLGLIKHHPVFDKIPTH
jgi:hypothetical protein